MRRDRFALWYWMLLLVTSCCESATGNSAVRYEIHADITTTNRSDNEELVRYNLRENSKDNGDYTQDEFHAHSTKDREGGNQTSAKVRAKSTKADERNSSTNSPELRGSLMQPEDRSNLTLYELQGKLYQNDITVPYETCENNTCILLCCPLGSHLHKVDKKTEVCTNEKTNYLFPDLYDYVQENDSWKEIPLGKKLDQVFQLSIYDPCKFGRYLLEPHVNPNDSYTILDNGTLYHPYIDSYVESYCLAVMDENDKFEITACFDSEDEVDSEKRPRKTAGIPVGLMISLPFFLATFVVYSILPELRNMHGYTLRAYVGSLFIAYMFLGILQLMPPFALSQSACIVWAFIMHFSFLASFFWLNVMCFDIWWTFGGFRSLQGSMKQRERKKFVMYSIYAWGSASLLSILCAIMDFVPSVPPELIRPEFGETSCWFNTTEAKALYFYGPMSLTVICNICLFISTALKIVRHKKDTAHHLRGSESRRHDDNKQRFNLYLKLFIVMGINWSMEIISWLLEKKAPRYIWYLTDLTNTLQGLIIFIIFVWKEKIKRLLLKRFGCQDRDIFSRNSTHSGFPSSASRTCTTTTSGVMSLQEKANPYAQTNFRAKSSSDEADT